jgi:hypothetical protein
VIIDWRTSDNCKAVKFVSRSSHNLNFIPATKITKNGSVGELNRNTSQYNIKNKLFLIETEWYISKIGIDFE